MNREQSHWNEIYAAKNLDETSWFQQEPVTSLRLITQMSDNTDPIIDIGAGGSRLVDELLLLGYQDLTILDVSDVVLQSVRERVEKERYTISTTTEDVTLWTPLRKYKVWHDRAVFHFMNNEESRNAYVRTLRKSIQIGGAAVIATFAEDGPELCSGLTVKRYSIEDMGIAMGDQFSLHHFEREVHITPWGVEQPFNWYVFK